MQSDNYVPGVSGWKMHSSGEFEINSAKSSVGGLTEQPQREIERRKVTDK